ncbi:MAG: serine/threonine-protein kinase [Pseudomonadota bacterium]
MTYSSDELEREAMKALDAVFEQPSDQRDAWARTQYADNPDLLARVLQLLQSESDGIGEFRTGGAQQLLEDEFHPERAGAYKIVGLIGRGGMGAVYKGERDVGDFEHHVAIKVIRSGLLSDALIERFETERQILARLNHSGIARLFDGGTLPDGSPYIVMEYVDGTPITEWAEQQNLSLDDRLWVFNDVCAAVEYAHQNLVIHRDITPSNVMVDHKGAIKLIDFGIAKPQAMDDSLEPIEPGSLQSLSFTPGFAAPERSLGAPANTLSDIYSLGKLLEALLKDVSLPPDLKAIIERATEKEPQNRYPSVYALSDDLKNFRTGYPVEAANGGGWYLWTKYFRRRRFLILGTVSAVVALSATLAGTLLQYQRAEAERVAAEARFQDVRDLANFMMFDLYDELEKAPGNTKAIGMLADRSQSYLESLAADERASLDVQIETGEGFKRLADIIGNPKNQNLGLRAEAGELLQQADAYLASIYTENNDSTELRRTLADTKFAYAVHKYVSDNDNEGAHILAADAARLFESLARVEDASYADRSNFIRAKMMSAVPLPWIGRDQEGIDILEDVRAEAKALVESDPDNLDAMNLLGSMNVELARATVRYENNGGPSADILPIWDEAIELRLAVYAARPEDSRPYRSLVSLYSGRSATYRANDQLEESLRDLEAAEQIGLELLEVDPDDTWLLRMIGGAREERIITLSTAGRHDEAIALLRISYPAALQEYETYAANPGYLREWAYTQVVFADALLKAGIEDEGCDMAEAARASWTQLGEESEIADADRNTSIASLETLEASCGL